MGGRYTRGLDAILALPLYCVTKHTIILQSGLMVAPELHLHAQGGRIQGASGSGGGEREGGGGAYSRTDSYGIAGLVRREREKSDITYCWSCFWCQ